GTAGIIRSSGTPTMLIVVAVYLYALSVSLLLLMLWQYLKGKAELMSVRNFIVLGFITFQLSGAAGAVILGGDGVFTLQTPVYTSLVYAAMATTFVAVFFFSYRRATISQW